ncbi:MAG: hypothetical protein NZ869_10720 [Thermoanaerobaculum sp.]|nr:hypothetical protein [Thermoanaerobaculum sp.]MDW7967386.1 hypothetical protein [Thermoanaerobaculum sp.]
MRPACTMALAGSYYFRRQWRLDMELIPANPEAPQARLAWALGLTKGGKSHAFTLDLGNVRATVTDLLAGSHFPGGFRRQDVPRFQADSAVSRLSHASGTPTRN